MYEKVIYSSCTERFSEIYVKDEAETKIIAVDSLAPGSKLYVTREAVLYILDEFRGNWYDTDGNKLQADGGELETTLSLTNLTGYATAYNNRPFEAKLTANSGCALPTAVTVSVGGTTLTAGSDYTYSNGIIAINAEKVTGDVIITAAGVEK